MNNDNISWCWYFGRSCLVQMRWSLGPTVSCINRGMSKPLVQMMHIHTLSLQSSSGIGRTAGRKPPCLLARSQWLHSATVSRQQELISCLGGGFSMHFMGKKCQEELHLSCQVHFWFFSFIQHYFGELRESCLGKKLMLWSLHLFIHPCAKHKDVGVHVHVRGGK